MGKVLVNNVEVEVGDHERLNGIQVAKRAGVEIPYYCWHPGLTVVASCRMCLVETGTRNPQTGAVQMMPKLVPACQTPAKDGTVFVTESEKIKQSRAFVEEALLIDHPIDCPICDKAGECSLQDYHFEHGQDQRRADIRPFTSRKRPMGDTVMLFVDRCVMCSRCVRFCREISGTSELMVIDRGSHEEIDVLPGYPLANKLSGNVVDLCPVGALGDRDFLYRQRVWFMKSHAQVCTRCSTGCSVWADENQDRVYRLRPRENPHVNQWWMCDEGRYGFHYVHDPKRLVGARRRDGERHINIEWSEVAEQLPERLGKAGPLAAVLSPHLTVEEAYLLAKLMRQLDPQALLAMGPAPLVGEDERFKNGFTIRAEKCPNRRGVEQIVRHFMGRDIGFEDLLSELGPSNIRRLWVTGGYPEPWIDESSAQQLSGLELLVVQDIFASPLWEQADFQLPGTAFPEREGSYVNHHERLQTVDWAIRPPAGARVEGSVYWRLLQMPGLYRARTVMEEIAATIPYFAPAAGNVPEHGVDLLAVAAR
jgi:NADH-quinone oxidoreductase subunit G